MAIKMQPENPSNPNIFNKIKKALKPNKRIQDADNRMLQYAALIPVYNIRDLEQRRTEIQDMLQDIEGKTITPDLQKETIDKTYRLFFQSGSPWIRGLDNRELTHKVGQFVKLYNQVGELPAFRSDLFMCSMFLLHLSFRAIDVTNTPPIMIQSTPILAPPQNPARLDMSGSGIPPPPPEQIQQKTKKREIV
jgi:hypothetical protein